MSDMWREREAGLSGTWSCVRCWEGAEKESVKRALWVVHNYFQYLPAVAAAMLAMLPSPIVCSSLPKLFQDCLYRACLSHISTLLHQAFAADMCLVLTYLHLLSKWYGSKYSMPEALRTYFGGFCALHEGRYWC